MNHRPGADILPIHSTPRQHNLIFTYAFTYIFICILIYLHQSYFQPDIMIFWYMIIFLITFLCSTFRAVPTYLFMYFCAYLLPVHSVPNYLFAVSLRFPNNFFAQFFFFVQYLFTLSRTFRAYLITVPSVPIYLIAVLFRTVPIYHLLLCPIFTYFAVFFEQLSLN